MQLRGSVQGVTRCRVACGGLMKGSGQQLRRPSFEITGGVRVHDRARAMARVRVKHSFQANIMPEEAIEFIIFGACTLI